jgi:hypothetical protein
MGKADKMVGGNKVKLPKVEWSVDVDLGADRIVIHGESPTAEMAALDANRARQKLHDTLRGDAAAREATEGEDKDKARR